MARVKLWILLLVAAFCSCTIEKDIELNQHICRFDHFKEKFENGRSYWQVIIKDERGLPLLIGQLLTDTTGYNKGQAYTVYLKN